jgi:hypothetical protein
MTAGVAGRVEAAGLFRHEFLCQRSAARAVAVLFLSVLFRDGTESASAAARA